MRVEKKSKAFAYRVPIGDYNYLQCINIKSAFMSCIHDPLNVLNIHEFDEMNTYLENQEILESFWLR